MAKRLMDYARSGWNDYQAKPAKRKYIPKANGKLRPLGIPTVEDRVIQHVVKTTIEPHYEAQFESCSYGFRPAMSTHDAIEAIFNATSHKPKWVLDADIKGCFDNISHDFLLNQIDAEWKPFVREWLKAGYVDDGHLHPTDSGTPQGGIISPLLANIALDNLERDLIASLRKIKGWKQRVGIGRNQKLKVIRYADDFVVLHEDKEVIEKAQIVIQEWLTSRGLELSPEKTRIVHTTEGFKFLGCTVKHYKNNKIKGHYKRALMKDDKGKRRVEKEVILQITPSKEKVQKHKERLAEIFSQMKAASQDALIKRLNPVIRGWANYYRYIVSSPTFAELDNYLWEKLWRWARRRHPMKSKSWVRKRYFTQSRERSWDFTTKDNKIHWHAHSKVPIGSKDSYVKVKEGKSYYDGDTPYWAQRLRSGYDSISPSKAKLLKEQNGKCPVCGGLFKSEDLTETHHLKAKMDGGDDKYPNLAIVHRHCHDQLHAANVSSGNKNNTIKKNQKKGLLARIKGRIFGDVS